VSKSASTLQRRLVSINQAADYADVSTKTIRRRIADGTIPAERLGPRLIRVRLDAVDAAFHPIPTTGPAA
jgi:excisionase family DNA binding protein